MMKKNLNVDAMILDLRNVQEDFLDRYEQIMLDCIEGKLRPERLPHTSQPALREVVAADGNPHA